MISFLLFFIIIFAAGSIYGNRFFAAKGYTGPISDHFDGTHFFSYANRASRADSSDVSRAAQYNELKYDDEPRSVLRWLIKRTPRKWEYRSVTPTVPQARVAGEKIVVTYINHSTVLLQTEGVNIITDPVWAERVSPFSFAGPIRHQNAGVRFEDLPPIDIVLLSHNHYDHMDIETLQSLYNRFKPVMIVPLGNAVYLAERGIKSAVELDWSGVYENSNALRIVSVPAQHFSSRGFTDRNKTLWSGYVIETPNGNIYFAGDTGYGPFVEKIKEKYPDGFRLGLLPIGAFKPRFIMRDVHISPDEAYRMKKELAIRQAVAIHFGTFALADDSQDDPVARIKELTEANQDNSFVTLVNGGVFEVK